MSAKKGDIEAETRDSENMNYDYKRQNEPSRRMGQGDFANMPKDVVMKSFSRTKDYRGGLINSTTCGIYDDSGIEENYKEK